MGATAIFSCMLLLLLSMGGSLLGCTGIRLKAKDGSYVHGRTLEFAIPLDISVLFVPRGHSFVGTTPDGPGASWTSKYAAVGAMAFNKVAFLDGINEKGLAAAVFYFTGFAEYSKNSKDNRARAVAPTEFVHWILTQYATIDEVCAHLPQVTIVPTVSKEWGPEAPPFHYIVYDKSGRCLVIEPIKGQLIAQENKLGVFTNAPDFGWHMTNLCNYINLAAMNKDPIHVENVELKPLGQGSGMLGLPGDFTPPSRFVRATVFSANAMPSENAQEAVTQAFHILNQFDIPYGAVREREGNMEYVEKTSLTAVRDPQSLQIYFKMYHDQTIHTVDLKAFDYDGASVQKWPLEDGPQKVRDISTLVQ